MTVLGKVFKRCSSECLLESQPSTLFFLFAKITMYTRHTTRVAAFKAGGKDAAYFFLIITYRFSVLLSYPEIVVHCVKVTLYNL